MAISAPDYWSLREILMRASLVTRTVFPETSGRARGLSDVRFSLSADFKIRAGWI